MHVLKSVAPRNLLTHGGGVCRCTRVRSLGLSPGDGRPRPLLEVESSIEPPTPIFVCEISGWPAFGPDTRDPPPPSRPPLELPTGHNHDKASLCRRKSPQIPESESGS